MTNYEHLLALVRENGMNSKWSAMFVKKLMDDEKAFSVSEEQKHWALEKGFYPGRIELFGLNDEKYRDYLPDWNYFMIHPINHHFRIWVNDKLTLKYVLNSNGCEKTMPEYYLYVENNGNYTYLMDAPASVKKDESFIFNLLKERGSLAVKPNSGTSGGVGFMKLEWMNNSIYINNKLVSQSEFEEIVGKLSNHIVTEYAHQHTDLATIWPSSECTLRVIMVKLPPHTFSAPSKWSCIVSYARFGTSVSGGVGIGFDFETGAFCSHGIRYKRFCTDGVWRIDRHPDTKAVFKGFVLPNWSYVKSMIENVCQHISSLDYLGFDVIITPDGLKFCEINTHPAVDYEQVMCEPVLKKEGARRFFEEKGLYQVNSRDFFRLYQESQI